MGPNEAILQIQWSHFGNPIFDPANKCYMTKKTDQKLLQSHSSDSRALQDQKSRNNWT